MKEVGQEEFYKAIGRLNVTARPIGNYPYKTEFSLVDGQVVGYVQDTEDMNISRYFMITSQTERGEWDGAD